MIAIFNTALEAKAYSDKIHQYLLANRPGYNAVKWCDPEVSADGLTWFVKEPVEQEEQKWPVPITTTTERAKAIDITVPLPEPGQPVTIGKYYLFKGDVVKCRQTHNRSIWEPKDTPALFSFFRDNSGQLEWIAGEQVELTWERIFNGKRYKVIQAHQTQIDWKPDVATTLWSLVVAPGTAWSALSVPYALNVQVTYLGNTYKCISAHVSNAGWTPTAATTLWARVVVNGQPWSGSSVAYALNNTVTYLGFTYRCITSHTSNAGWSPTAAGTLWVKI